jgi:hypothetical protein
MKQKKKGQSCHSAGFDYKPTGLNRPCLSYFGFDKFGENRVKKFTTGSVHVHRRSPSTQT